MSQQKSPLLVANYNALGVSLIILVTIFVALIGVIAFNGGLFFGLMLGLFYPVVLLFVIVGAILYFGLLLFNIRATSKSRKDVVSSQENRRIWITFSGTTAAVILITVIFGLVSTPMIIIFAREFAKHSPFKTSSVRNVPVYPVEVWDDQSQYDEIGETFFRSYNVPNSHPDEVAAWHESRFSKSPWSIIEINHYIDTDQYIGRMSYYCFQVKKDDKSNQPHTFFIEIFGEDLKTYDGTHVNIGTPKPITNVCKQFLDKP